MSSPAIAPGVYFIQNRKTQVVVDLDSGSDAPGTETHGQKKRDLSDTLVGAQLWVIYPVGGTSAAYYIRNVNTNTFLDIPDGNNANGTPIVGNPLATTGKNTQQWFIDPTTDGTALVIRNEASNTYLDYYLGGDVPNPPAIINGWGGSGPSTGNDHQIWLFKSS